MPQAMAAPQSRERAVTPEGGARFILAEFFEGEYRGEKELITVGDNSGEGYAIRDIGRDGFAGEPGRPGYLVLQFFGLGAGCRG